MATEKMTMIKNFDYDEFSKWAGSIGKNANDISRELGFNGSYFTNARARNRLSKSTYKFLLMNYNLPEGSFIKKESEPVKETTTQVESTVANSDAVIPKLEELNIAINKLGNIMMQMLEYVKDIRDEVK